MSIVPYAYESHVASQLKHGDFKMHSQVENESEKENVNVIIEPENVRFNVIYTKDEVDELLASSGR